jgi:hypothetical protein
MEKDERGPRRKVTGGAGFVTAWDQAPSQADRQERPTSADSTCLGGCGNAEACARRSFIRTTGEPESGRSRRPTIDADFRRGWHLLGPRTAHAHALRYHPAP